MNLKDYIDINKIKKDIFITLYNKDDKWIISGLQDDPRMNDYINEEVNLKELSKFIIQLKMINYKSVMQVAYDRMMIEKEQNKKERNIRGK